MFFCRYIAVVFCFVTFFCLLKQAQAEQFLTLPLEDSDPYIYQGWTYNTTEISGSTTHEGIDYDCNEGDPIVAAADGRAMAAYGGGYGYFVRIQHDNGMETMYAHLSAYVSTIPYMGDNSSARNNADYDSWVDVGQGDVIGYCSNTETSIVHLHFELTTGGYGGSCGCRVDPYDIYSTDDDYPDLDTTADCGTSHYWTWCPPTNVGRVVLQTSISSNEITDHDSIDADGNLQVGEWVDFTITTLSSYDELVVKITNLSADLDLYLQKDEPPTEDTWDCRPYNSGTASEKCAFETTEDETWYARVYGYEEGSFTIEALWYGSDSDADPDNLARLESSADSGSSSETDSDGDGLSDEEEITWGTRNGDTDTDSDDLTDGEEVHTYGTDPLDGDSDDDGLEDGLEIGISTDPNDTDSDDDGYSDGEEINNGYDPTDTNDPVNPSDVDNDGDGYTVDGGDCNDSSASIYPGTTATEFCSDDIDINCDGDSDGDGLSDDNEMGLGTDPYDCDTDGEGLEDGEEVNTYSTNPLDTDSDEDALSDQGEVGTYFTNPNDNDSDDDGLYDGDEVNDGMDPLDTDTDDDSFSDAQEISKEWDPLDILDPKKRMIPILAGYLTPTDTDGDGIDDDDEVREGSNPNDSSSVACIEPDSGTEWTITSDCTFFSSKTWSGNLYVQSEAVVTIPSGISLDLDLSQKKLVVQSGSGILIEQGGKIY